MVRKISVPRSKRQYVEGHNSAALRLVRSFPRAKQTIFPGFIPPSLATLAPRPPRGDGWVHEIKYDGYRFQCHIQRTVRFYTRRGNDWTGRVTHLVNALQPLSDRSMILDGEVIVETPDGRSDFHALEKELKATGGSRRLVFYVFDILYFGGYDLREVPLLDRKRVLREVMEDRTDQIQ
jgi:bifunctional non-homologous end joining protein LigD